MVKGESMFTRPTKKGEETPRGKNYLDRGWLGLEKFSHRRSLCKQGVVLKHWCIWVLLMVL
jgi:hypothetical protein